MTRLRYFLSNQWFPMAQVCALAAHQGFLEVLEYAHDNGRPWSEKACLGAARTGRLEIMRWLWERRCAWNSLVFDLADAAGHENTVQWARENGCPEKAIGDGDGAETESDVV